MILLLIKKCLRNNTDTKILGGLMKYLGFYDIDSNDESRIRPISSKNKMEYVFQTLNKAGIYVEVISPSWTLKKTYFPSRLSNISKNTSLKVGPTIPYTKNVSQIWSLIWYFLYLFFSINKNETIIVYHSLSLIPIIKLLKFFKKIKVILEVEEIYGEVLNKSNRAKEIEIKYIKKMDSRIFVSDLLKEKVGISSDIVLYGSYTSKNFNLNRISKSMVYAGSIDQLKGGAFVSVELMKFIEDQRITLNILGTGTDSEISKLKSKIREVNIQKKYEAVKFLGLKTGEEFDEIMNTFEFGLNLQNQGDYMDTAFPSKIITYLSYGLQIISSNIRSIQISPFSNEIDFVNINDLKKAASQISNIVETYSVESSKNTVLINKYDKMFYEDLKKLVFNLESLEVKEI